MENKWLIVAENYSGLTARAVDRVASAISELAGYPLPILPRGECGLLSGNNVILIGTSKMPELAAVIESGVLSPPERAQGYSVKLTASPFSGGHQLLAVCGYDEAGTLYGAVDFIARYIGHDMHTRDDLPLMNSDYKDIHFRRRMPEWSLRSSPAIDRRGLWTWGHCIYDHRRFLDNMLALKLNQLVIWNDFVPLNAKAVVDCAHERGIEVYWGFSWGWDNRSVGFDVTDDSVLEGWCERILTQYERDYAPTGADGIYFQSFTETGDDMIGGCLIADVVVKWVNTIGSRLLERHPSLELQFGLHATSVRTHLDSIARTDPRIRIVWEDCGSFPYAYLPRHTSGFDETLALNERLCSLRGEGEKFGAVLKGMTTLDWNHFEHQTGSFVLGESSPEYVAARAREKARLWRILQSDWIASIELARRLTADIARLVGGRSGSTVQWLVEDGCFEAAIPYPAALAAELIWDSEVGSSELLVRAASDPRVHFAD